MNEFLNELMNEEDPPELPLDPAITQDLYLQWRAPRFGVTNPELMSNPVWDWLVRSKISAHAMNEKIGGSDSLRAGPAWCFDRFGQSSTPLPDGRIVMIGGEHEDYYDPDFYIYNDVVVMHLDGRLELFGYPKDIFCPTDFHSATLIGDKIIIIGCLGYCDQRNASTTPVFILNLETFAISTVVPSGCPPCWLHEHTASLSDDGCSILLSGGRVLGKNGQPLIRNLDDWQLNTVDWRWSKLTERQWQRWQVYRQDVKQLCLWEIRQALWERDVSWLKQTNECSSDEGESYRIPTLEEELGFQPDLDLVKKLFNPDIEHIEVPNDKEEYRVHRIKVLDVIVYYEENLDCIQVTFEGVLPQTIIDGVIENLKEKLTQLLHCPCKSEMLE